MTSMETATTTTTTTLPAYGHSAPRSLQHSFSHLAVSLTSPTVVSGSSIAFLLGSLLHLTLTPAKSSISSSFSSLSASFTGHTILEASGSRSSEKRTLARTTTKITLDAAKEDPKEWTLELPIPELSDCACGWLETADAEGGRISLPPTVELAEVASQAGKKVGGKFVVRYEVVLTLSPRRGYKSDVSFCIPITIISLSPTDLSTGLTLDSPSPSPHHRSTLLPPLPTSIVISPSSSASGYLTSPLISATLSHHLSHEPDNLLVLLSLSLLLAPDLPDHILDALRVPHQIFSLGRRVVPFQSPAPPPSSENLSILKTENSLQEVRVVKGEEGTEVRWSEVVRVRKEEVRLGQSCDGEIQVYAIAVLSTEPFSHRAEGVVRLLGAQIEPPAYETQ